MYSTYAGAKKSAKDLKRLLDHSGFEYPLNKCQLAVARAGGFRDWKDLEGVLKSSSRAVVPATYRKRLIRALPKPCHAPVHAWLHSEPDPAEQDPEPPRRWHRDACPYIRATEFIHRKTTALLNPGSGAGLRRRQRIVEDLLFEYQASSSVPLLEPDTLAVVIRLDQLHDDTQFWLPHGTELKALLEARVLDLDSDRIRVLSPDPLAVRHRAVVSAAHGAQYKYDQGRSIAVNGVRDALAFIGVSHALQESETIVRGDPESYSIETGAVSRLLFRLAEEGDPELLGATYLLFATLQPESQAFLRQQLLLSVPQLYLQKI